MSFVYTPYPEEATDRRWQRALSVLPALLSWTILIALTVLGIALPSAGAALMIALLLYYVVRIAHNGAAAYLGSLTRFSQTATACTCSDQNSRVWINTGNIPSP